MAQDPTTFEFPTIGNKVRGRATLLAIDDALIPLKRNLPYYLTKPTVRPEPVMGPSRDDPNAPDWLAAHFYGSVIQDGGKFRMWYYPGNVGPNSDWTPEQVAQMKPVGPRDYCLGPPAYAESDDGIHWVKPKLRQMSYRGSLEHNAFNLPDPFVMSVAVIKDDEDPNPARRYKMTYEYARSIETANWAERWGTMRTAVSPDGIHWTVSPPMIVDDFVELCSFFKHNGLYIVSGQKMGGWAYREGGSQGGRQGYVWVSADFEHWQIEAAESFAFADPEDPAKRGGDKVYDQVHLGVGATSLGNVLVGLYANWHHKEAFSKISADFGLVVSNDGLAFREPVKGHVWLRSQDSAATPINGKDHPTVLCQANGIINVGHETRIYHGRWRNIGMESEGHPIEEYGGEVALATLPRDRWGALGLPGAVEGWPTPNEGSAWSAPVRLAQRGCELTLNVEGGSGVTVEVGDEQFRPIAGYSGTDAGVVVGESGLDCPVRFAKGALGALAGRTVRLRLKLRRLSDSTPRVFALYLTSR